MDFHHGQTYGIPCTSVVLQDGKRPRLVLYFPEGTKQFQFNTLLLDDDGQGRYHGIIYDIMFAWGSGVRVAFMNRITACETLAKQWPRHLLHASS